MWMKMGIEMELDMEIKVEIEMGMQMGMQMQMEMGMEMEAEMQMKVEMALQMRMEIDIQGGVILRIFVNWRWHKSEILPGKVLIVADVYLARKWFSDQNTSTCCPCGRPQIIKNMKTYLLA